MRGGQSYRVLASAQRDLRLHDLPRVSRPVNVSDEGAFPEIARAIEHARKLRERGQ